MKRINIKQNSDIKIETLILVLRGEKVILDSDLARIYGVTTTRFNQHIRRNIERFPEDFMFHLTNNENRRLMLQIATSKKRRGVRRILPFVFTEHGAIMAANLLNSPRAVESKTLGLHAEQPTLH